VASDAGTLPLSVADLAAFGEDQFHHVIPALRVRRQWGC
jgi:hypothetical protein